MQARKLQQCLSTLENLESSCVHCCVHCCVHVHCWKLFELSHFSEQVRQRRDSVKHNRVCCCHCWWRTFVIFCAARLLCTRTSYNLGDLGPGKKRSDCIGTLPLSISFYFNMQHANSGVTPKAHDPAALEEIHGDVIQRFNEDWRLLEEALHALSSLAKEHLGRNVLRCSKKLRNPETTS